MSDDKKNKKNETSPFAGALADKLKDLDIEPSERDSEASKEPRSKKEQASKTQTEQRRSATGKPAGSRRTPEPVVPSEPEGENLSDEELFARAVQDLGADDVYRGKFEGEGPRGSQPASETGENVEAEGVDHEPADEVDEVDEEYAREEIAERRQRLTFERAIGPVDETVDRSKYRRRELPDPAELAERRGAYRSDSPEDLNTPALPKTGEGLNHVRPLHATQKELLQRYAKRSRRHEVAELNVRGDIVDDALRQLELFIHMEWKNAAHFVRIIHGRGLRSQGDPVLKPAVLRWLEGPGFRYVRGYAPEVNNAGDYGSVIVELDPKPPTNHD